MTLLIDFLGCKVNSYEVEAVGETFLKNGFSFFDKSKDKSPTVIIINTCAVTQTSVTKDRKIIKRYRKQYPESVLVVMGCYAQFDYKNISESLDADIVIGTSNRAKVYGLVNDFLKKHEENKHLYFFSTKAQKCYSDIQYGLPDEDIYLIFGIICYN